MHQKSFLPFLAVAVALMLCAAPIFGAGAGAGVSQFGSSTFPLEGSQEVPPVTTDASGSCTGTLDPLGTEFSVTCTNSVQDLAAAHIHMAPAGENGPIVFFFSPSTTFTGVVSEASLQEQQSNPDTPVTPISFAEFHSLLLNGGLYVNLHSPTVPSGEIRGQISAPPWVTTFAQFGNGVMDNRTFQSDLVLLNSASTGDPVTGVARFYDRSGNIIPPEQILGTSSMAPAGVMDGVPVSVDPSSESTLSTSGMGDLVAGSVRVETDGPVTGLVRFDITGAGVAGVGESPILTGALAPARRVGSLSSGVALVNPGSAPITVELSLRSGAMEVGNTTVDLEPNGSVSRFIQELFEGSVGPDFSGVLIMESEGGFGAIVLEFDVNGVFTTLPVVPIG